MKTKQYRFYFNQGVPVLDWPHGKKVVGMKWRHGHRTIAAHSMIEAVRKLVQPFVQKHGYNAQLNLTTAWSRVENEPWQELNLDEPTFAAFMLGNSLTQP